MSEFKTLLAAEFAKYRILTSHQLDFLEAHYELIRLWNKKINLTRILPLEDVVQFHYCESLFLGEALPKSSLRIADLGSGAGFPGIPIAVVRPEYSVSLIESNQKKAAFLREASRGLPNVNVIASRAEDVMDSFDWVVSRAVNPATVRRLALAPQLALLVGATASSGADEARLKIPWGDGRVLVFVSRGIIALRD